MRSLFVFQLAVRLVLKEWQFSDGSVSLLSSINSQSLPSLNGSSSLQPKTGRKLMVTVVEGRNLPGRDKSGKCDPYVKLQYGKVGYAFIVCILIKCPLHIFALTLPNCA